MSNYQMYAPPLSKSNKILLILAGSCFLLNAIFKAIGAGTLVPYLGLSGAGVFGGLVYQIVSYPFMEAGLMGMLFNGLLIWFIGSELESLWGQRIYLRFLLLTTVGVGIIYCAVGILFFGAGTVVYSHPIHGLSGINMALLMAYSYLYPDRQLSMMMIFPMRARTFCWILIGIEAYMAIFSSMVTAWAHLLAIGISWGIIHFQSRPLLKNLLNSTFSRKKSGKGHLYVVKDDDQKPPKYWQ